MLTKYLEQNKFTFNLYSSKNYNNYFLYNFAANILLPKYKNLISEALSYIHNEFLLPSEYCITNTIENLKIKIIESLFFHFYEHMLQPHNANISLTDKYILELKNKPLMTKIFLNLTPYKGYLKLKKFVQQKNDALIELIANARNETKLLIQAKIKETVIEHINIVLEHDSINQKFFPLVLNSMTQDEKEKLKYFIGIYYYRTYIVDLKDTLLSLICQENSKELSQDYYISFISKYVEFIWKNYYNKNFEKEWNNLATAFTKLFPANINLIHNHFLIPLQTKNIKEQTHTDAIKKAFNNINSPKYLTEEKKMTVLSQLKSYGCFSKKLFEKIWETELNKMFETKKIKHAKKFQHSNIADLLINSTKQKTPSQKDSTKNNTLLNQIEPLPMLNQFKNLHVNFNTQLDNFIQGDDFIYNDINSPEALATENELYVVPLQNKNQKKEEDKSLPQNNEQTTNNKEKEAKTKENNNLTQATTVLLNFDSVIEIKKDDNKNFLQK